MSRHSGIPLLSGPPPPRSGPVQNGCRKCGREFSIIFNRRRECMHCGYEYCSSCTDYRALLPRRGTSSGYDPAHVCAFCIEMLNITALGRAQLRILPLSKLRRYIDAYNIPVKNPIDKNDLVDAAIAARTAQGCLSPVNEDYYRKHSVPTSSTPGSSSFFSSSSTNRDTSTRGFPSTSTNSNSRPNRSFSRPDLDPNRRQRPQEAPYATYTPRSNTQRSRTTSTPVNPGTTRRPSAQPDASRPPSFTGRPASPHAASAARAPSPPPATPPKPPPPMSTLVTLPRSALSALSVGTLKHILWEARVRIPPAVVEKEELVDRVWAIIEEEKRKDEECLEDDGLDMDVDQAEPDREEEVVVEMVNPESEAWQQGTHENNQESNGRPAVDDHVQHDSGMAHEEHLSMPPTDPNIPTPQAPSPQMSSSPPQPSTSPPRAVANPKPRHPKPTTAERSGLCVVCQDEEACIAIVDCGHLALCRECSDLVLAGSRECPLCRTRIVTEARLLRIFKT